MSEQDGVTINATPVFMGLGVLTVLFIALKSLGLVYWSWAWVLSPVWITAVIILAVIVSILLYVTVTGGHVEVSRQRDKGPTV